MINSNRLSQVKKGHNYSIHAENWLTRFDHNHLRITRIIRSLRVLGLEEEALAFYDIISTATIVSSRSRMYWGRAAHRPLNIRPDIDDEDVDEERIGPKFLREFEQSKKDRACQVIAESELTVEPMKDETAQDKPDKVDGLLGDSERLESAAGVTKPT